MSMHRLLWRVYNQLNVLGVFGAMAGGEGRRENLIALYEHARAFEGAGYKGLFAFVGGAEHGDEGHVLAGIVQNLQQGEHHRHLGDMDYREQEALHFGADYLPARTDCPAEFRGCPSSASAASGNWRYFSRKMEGSARRKR